MAVFQGGNVDTEPTKYRVWYKTRDGQEKYETTIPIPDPKDAKKVKDHLIQTRNDLYLAGVTDATLNVEIIGPATAADRARLSNALAGSPTPVKPSEQK